MFVSNLTMIKYVWIRDTAPLKVEVATYKLNILVQVTKTEHWIIKITEHNCCFPMKTHESHSS